MNMTNKIDGITNKFDGMPLNQEENLRSWEQLGGGRRLPSVYIKDGKYLMSAGKNKTVDVTGAACVALVDKTTGYWRYWNEETKRFERYSTVNCMTSKPPDRPNVYTDKTKWKYNKNRDKQFDPLKLCLELPLQIQDTGNLICFIADDFTQHRAVSALLKTFRENKRRPVIELGFKAADWIDDNGQEKQDAYFEILGADPGDADLVDDVPDDQGDIAVIDVKHDEHGLKADPSISTGPISGNGAAPSKSANDSTSVAGMAPRRNSDMDDDIPFLAEWR
jgi:hypothetical protein